MMQLFIQIWLFAQTLNLSNHILVVFLGNRWLFDSHKDIPAGYFEVGAVFDFILLLLGLSQVIVAPTIYNSEFTRWAILSTSALNLPAHLWYITGDAMEVIRHALSVAQPGEGLSSDKLTAYFDVLCHTIAASALLNEVITSGCSMSIALCIVSFAVLVACINTKISVHVVHTARRHEQDRTAHPRQKLNRLASLETLFMAMEKKQKRERAAILALATPCTMAYKMD
jgi:hypothetical protein